MDELIRFILESLISLGYLGIVLGLMVEVIPSEIVLAFAGFLVGQGELSFVGAVVAGTIGGVLAQLFLYGISYYGGRPLLNKYGKYILIQQQHLAISEAWFHRYGTGVIFGARFIPVVRHAISIPAGLAKMSVIRFTVLTTLAVIPWSIFFIWLGKVLGNNWGEIRAVSSPYIVPVAIGAFVLLVLYIMIKRYYGDGVSS
ncbi:DedA family protein [Hazenella sp. IB182357]|uniref:DedA family protein n=1 Tax=Polycladospora coralii TaxID=2771432 RepID=A0A926N968_9BACL|nr:DedA family protein [Polycladospora coralii]MBD1370760.1 DedA family protein [Polycladospora coralii]MBS7529698.1 DedA family protein [Polycladospora coralii]